jgi:hypothetical protein
LSTQTVKDDVQSLAIEFSLNEAQPVRDCRVVGQGAVQGVETDSVVGVDTRTYWYRNVPL